MHLKIWHFGTLAYWIKKLSTEVKIQSYEQNDELKKLREVLKEGLLKTFNKTLLLILNIYTGASFKKVFT
jgi:hypothetical protein